MKKRHFGSVPAIAISMPKKKRRPRGNGKRISEGLRKQLPGNATRIAHRSHGFNMAWGKKNTADRWQMLRPTGGYR
jgi:hypothetical protein